MAREVDLLLGLDHDQVTVVEKATNVVWEKSDFQSDNLDKHYFQEDDITPTDHDDFVSNPYPGCLQLGGASEQYENYRLFAQTRHFLLFEKTKP